MFSWEILDVTHPGWFFFAGELKPKFASLYIHTSRRVRSPAVHIEKKKVETAKKKNLLFRKYEIECEKQFILDVIKESLTLEMIINRRSESVIMILDEWIALLNDLGEEKEPISLPENKYEWSCPKPIVAFFGHIHEQSGIEELNGTTLEQVPAANSYKAAVVEIKNKKVSVEFIEL